MDKTNNIITETITETLGGPSSDIGFSESFNNGNSTSFFDNLSNVSVSTWIIIIIILAILGFNIFIYFAKGTQYIANFMEKIFYFFGIVTGQAVDVSAKGAKAVVGVTKDAVNISADAIDSGLNKLQEKIPDAKNAGTSLKGSGLDEHREIHVDQKNELNNILNKNKSQMDYQADDVSSSIQGNNKSGWCYVGSDRNFRSCAYVGIDDKCMSGEIFPSHELCINPSLRA